jgi:acetoin utilization deacetylase AcuC-like enzyme
MKPIGVHYDPCYERHDTGPGHPESAARYRVLREALENLPDDIVRLPGRKATVAEVLLAHEPYYHDLVYRDVISCADQLRTGDTAICEDSYDVALEATGAVIEAVDAVMRGEIARAFCAVRPPGHHATATRGMGFCIFNHIAIAANHLRRVHGLTRIAIVDWDYVSLHEGEIYPYTGRAADRGSGAGEGFTLNLPLPHGTDGSVALAAWDEHGAPALEAFQPEFVLVSAGFDARKDDPLGGLRWDDETFAAFTRRVVSLAETHARGRVVASLEGGYHPPGLASAAVAHVIALR